MEKTTTSVKCWQISLNLLLNQAENKSGRRPRIVIMGIGNELRADDAAGMLVARRLLEHECVTEKKERIRVVQAEHAPENATWELRGFEPHLIVLVDAAEMGQSPGLIRWIEMEDIEGMSASTHSLPLSMLSRYLMLEFNCPVALLGIQPASNEFGEPVSPEVLHAVDEIVDGILDGICKTEFPPSKVGRHFLKE
jgi:hydrogenase 3 maturation protease